MSEMDFTFDMELVDRQALLRDAAARLDALSAHLGPDEGSLDGGSLARELDSDVVEFAPFPLIQRLSAAQFQARDGHVPSQMEMLGEGEAFYRFEFPLTLWPRFSWSFDRLEMQIKFDAENTLPPSKPRIVDILPNREIISLASVQQDVRVTVGANLKFSAASPPIETAGITVDASANLATQGGLEAAIGPFNYELRRAVIDHSPPGTSRVFWRIEGGQLITENTPRLMLIVHLPPSSKGVQVHGILQAYRNYNFLSDRTRNTIKELPRALKNFFENGAPIRATAVYEVP